MLYILLNRQLELINNYFFIVWFVGFWLFVFGFELDWLCPAEFELDAAAWFFGWPTGAGFVDLTWFWFEGACFDESFVVVWFVFDLFVSLTSLSSLSISCFCCVINASLLISSLSRLVYVLFGFSIGCLFCCGWWFW